MGLSAFEDSAIRSTNSLSWIETRQAANNILVRSLLLELHPGEAEAIALAVEMKADILLIDERRSREVASRLKLRVVGLLGSLVEAKRRGLVQEVKPVLDDLIAKAGFWVGKELYALVLEAAAK